MRFDLTDFDHGCFVGEKIFQLYIKHGGKHPNIVTAKQQKPIFFFDEVYAELKPMIEKKQISETTQKRIARMTYRSAWEQYSRLEEAQQERFYECLWDDLEIKAGRLNKYDMLGYDMQEIEQEEKPEQLKDIKVLEEWTDSKGRKNYKAEDGETYLILHNELFKLNEEGEPIFEVKNFTLEINED